MIHNLQVLRAVAAGMVVLHHLRELIGVAVPVLATVEVGAAGVDIFFVLSGVVITLAEWGRTDGAYAFFCRRLVRILPMYWLTLWLIGLALIAGLSPMGVQPVDGTIGNMLRSMLFIPFERDHGAIMPLLGVGWTLNYEMFFYTTVALLLFLPGEVRVGALVIVMISLVAFGVFFPAKNVWVQFYTNPILLEFCAGVVIARIWKAWSVKPKTGLVLGLFLVMGGAVWFALAARPTQFNFLMQERVMWFGPPAVAWVAGALLLERSGFYLRSQSVLTMGAASYALYLTHGLVIQVIEKIAQKLGVVIEHGTTAVVTAVLMFAAAQIVGTLVHAFVELPITKTLKRNLLGEPSRSEKVLQTEAQ